MREDSLGTVDTALRLNCYDERCRANILTGLYDHNYHKRSNYLPSGSFEKFRGEGHEENTIATRLQEGGYLTAFFGKYLNE
jgi:N-acetylglucosamine-6-sulfatase